MDLLKAKTEAFKTKAKGLPKSQNRSLPYNKA